MDIEFDSEKSARNRAERGFGFETVSEFNFDTAMTWIDNRHDYGQERWSALGTISGRVHALVFIRFAHGIRVVSFRKANQREVRRYEEFTQS